MEYIIAARFDQQDQVTQTVEALERARIGADAIASFYLTPPREQGSTPDEQLAEVEPAHERAEKSPAGSAKGIGAGAAAGAVLGLAGAPVAGPIAPAIGALAGAYVGSLTGGLSEIKKTHGTHDTAPADEPRKAGLMIAVCVSEQAQEEAVVKVFRTLGGRDIERGEGTVADGRWQTFDPLKPMTRIDQD
jgi:phage tail tape-measure protein